MNSSRFPFLATLLFSVLLAAPLLAQERENAKKRVWNKEERERHEAWQSLDSEQREALREALRSVWTDPAVISAREEVKHASEAYQSAIKAAVERTDPEVAALLDKVRGPDKAGEGPGFPGSPGGPSRRGFDEQIKPPGFLESLSPEEREKFRKAEEEAKRSERVVAARAELAEIRKEDEALRRKRLEAHRRLRSVTLEEMIRIDPSVAAIQKRLDGDRHRGRKGGRDKGKGREMEKGGKKIGNDRDGGGPDAKPKAEKGKAPSEEAKRDDGGKAEKAEKP